MGEAAQGDEHGLVKGSAEHGVLDCLFAVRGNLRHVVLGDRPDVGAVDREPFVVEGHARCLGVLKRALQLGDRGEPRVVELAESFDHRSSSRVLGGRLRDWRQHGDGPAEGVEQVVLVRVDQTEHLARLLDAQPD
jgi:hypothetical protein